VTRLPDEVPSATAEAPPSGGDDRVLTVPNALSALRFLGVGLFLWLLLGPHADAGAVAVLAASAVTDWLDGVLARALGQTSRLGILLDPAADRLYIVSTVVALAVRGIIPYWLLGVLVFRDLALAATLPVLKRHGYGPLPVHFLGKTATLNLLYGFPLLLLAEILTPGLPGAIVGAFAWAFVGWGTALYWWAGGLYVVHVRKLLRADRLAAPSVGSLGSPR
jgi:CDP-diacylglycerol--glycerol-3-phosphate 3-phosphatidyltransferase